VDLPFVYDEIIERLQVYSILHYLHRWRSSLA
jgi:hypothetical protein